MGHGVHNKPCSLKALWLVKTDEGSTNKKLAIRKNASTTHCHSKWTSLIYRFYATTKTWNCQHFPSRATLSTAILMMGNRGEATRAVLMTTWAKKRLPIKPDHQKSNGCWSNINSAASTGDDIGCCYYCGLQGLLGKNLITFRSDSVVVVPLGHS